MLKGEGVNVPGTNFLAQGTWACALKKEVCVGFGLVCCLLVQGIKGFCWG